MNDYDLRGQDYDSCFATVKFYKSGVSSICHRAICLTAAKFDKSLPGWQLYYRLVSGDELFDRTLMAYAILMARALARSQTKNGRTYIGRATRGLWVKQAGLDGLHYAVYGKFPISLHERAAEFDVAHQTYQKIREPVGQAIRSGSDIWRAELHVNFTQLLLHQKYTALELAPE